MPSREKILEAARELFQSKGYEGTSMQDIADHAGINKGLLHYYFKSKHRIFHEVFMEAFKVFLPEINHVLNGNMSLKTKIGKLVVTYIDMCMANPMVPPFIISELSSRPEGFVAEIMSSDLRPNPIGFIAQVEAEIKVGHIRAVSPVDLILNIISMCVFPFVGRPLVQGIFSISKEQFGALMNNRKKEVHEFIWNSIQLSTADR